VKTTNRLPVLHDLGLAYAISLLIAVIMAVASLIGIVYPTAIYPTAELLQWFMPNDLINLFIGVPILLGSLWLARRGKLIGLLCWPGALLYVLYIYLAYVFGLPFNAAFLLHLTLITLSTYTLIGLVASIDGTAVQQQLTGVVPERGAGGVLIGLGALTFLRVVSVMVEALVNQTPMASTELAAMVSDFIVTPAWIIVGLLLWRRKVLGYVAGLGLLFQASMLFIGLIGFLLLQPLLTAAPFLLTDTVVVLGMGLICFIPFALFVRGVTSNRRSSPAQFAEPRSR